MRKTLEVFRFELVYHLGLRSTLAYFVILFALCSVFLQMLGGGPRPDGNFNAPFSLLVMAVLGSMLALLIVAGIAGDAATRDDDLRFDSLIYTSPVGKPAYLLGRFLGAFATSALLLLALPAGSWFATWMPWVPSENLGPFRADAYLAPYVLYVLPNAFVATSVIFVMALMTRRAIAGYGAAASLFFFAMICGKVLPPRMGWDTAKLLDPLGYTAVQAFWRSLDPVQKNTFVLTLDGALLANRLLWLGVALALLAAAYAGFTFEHAVAGRGAKSPRMTEAAHDPVSATQTSPVARRVFDGRTRMRQLLAVTTRSFHELHTSRAWWIVPVLALLFVIAAPELAQSELGVPGTLTTGRVATFFAYDDAMVLMTLLIALSAGELVWRERGARMHALAGVTPAPAWLSVAGRFLAMAMMLIATVTIFMLAGLIVQAINGVHQYDPGLYVRALFGLELPSYLLTAALAMLIHVLVNQKYVANALVVLVPVARELLRGLGVEHNLLLYGSLPRWTYTGLAGFGPGIQARVWFTVYFGGWALLFALMTYLFWIRGEEGGARQRLARARRRLTRPAAILGATALAIIAGTGAFIFYNTNVLNAFRTNAEMDRRAAELERRYGRYAWLPQPIVAATNLRVDFYPRRSAAVIRGVYRLDNRSHDAIDTIHVMTDPRARTSNVSFDRAARLTLADDDYGYRTYALGRRLQPGESLRMSFEVALDGRGFTNAGDNPPVMPNGSNLVHRPGRGQHNLPVIGYHRANEINDPALRKKYGLPERSKYPRLEDVAVRNEQRAHETIDLDTIVGTDGGEIGVAPGELLRTWMQNGRRYAHYRTDAPINNAWSILSANYAVHRAKWRDVDIEIFHHPEHTANLERMSRSIRASLDHNVREFGPYPHRQVRLVEFPSSAEWLQMTAHGGFILYAEGFSYARPEDDPRGIDFPFAVVAHEMGHQWWGQQLAPASVEGAGFLSESLAWYSGMLVIEETYGRDHLKQLLDAMRAQYMAPHQARTVPMLRMVDRFEAYRLGPFAMYALREAAGAAPVNRALRSVLAKFPPSRPPFPTMRDLYAELRAATPARLHGLLRDLFEEITFWDLRAKRMEVAAGGGGYRVTLHIDARKLRADATGTERPVPMDDPIEIAVDDANGRPLYRGRHRIRSGEQTIALVVSRPPARAAIDPDHELLDREPEDNEVRVGGG